MLDNWLKKWYKKSYQDTSVENPSTEVWENIASKLDDKSSFWYASNIASEENNEPVSPRVWENLSVYVEAQAVQAVQKRWRRVRNYGLTTVLLILPFFISDSFEAPMNVGPTHSSQGEIPSNSTNVAHTELETEMEPLLSKETVTVSVQNEEEIFGNHHQLITAENTRLVAENWPAANEINYRFDPDSKKTTVEVDEVSALPVKTIAVVDEFDLALERNLVTSENESHVNTGSTSRPSSNGKWRFGVGVNNQISNLLNPITQQGIDKDSGIDLSISRNYSFDVSLERKIGRYGYLGVTARLNDQKTQKYRDFYGSEYIEKQLSLTYQSLFLNYSQAILTKHFNKRFGLELNSGVYVAHLGDVTEKWDNQNRYELTEGFRKFDLGAMLGVSGNLRLSKSFDLNAGVYYSNGVINVFKGVETMPSYFFRTFTSSFGGTVKVRYYFGQ